MTCHMHLHNDCESKHTKCLNKIPGLCCMPPHLELKSMTAHSLQGPLLIESQPSLSIIPTMVIVPQQLVIRTCAEETL
jgi:hypothetical protein